MKTIPPYRCWAEIDFRALAFNLKQLRSLNPDSEVIGVIKADAYGHGMFDVSRELSREGVRTFAVANAFEAQVASRAVPSSNVLILGPLLKEEIPLVAKNARWMPTISSREELLNFERAAQRLHVRRKVHLKVDTGLGRLGCFPDEAMEICKRILKSKHISLAGLFTHLSSADFDRAETARQSNQLQKFCSRLIDQGYRLPMVHFQNSAGSLLSNGSYAHCTRPGLALYGVPIRKGAWERRFSVTPLKPVLSWKTRVVLLRNLPKGSTVSYARTYKAAKAIKTAVLSAGYADGIFRKLSNRGEVLIRGVRCPILGRVTMDLTVVNVSHVKNVRCYDEAVLIGKSGRGEIRVEEFAEWSETSPYETLCHVGKRVVRVPVSHS